MVTHVHVRNLKAKAREPPPEELTFQEELKDEEHLARRREHISAPALFTCQLKVVYVWLMLVSKRPGSSYFRD